MRTTDFECGPILSESTAACSLKNAAFCHWPAQIAAISFWQHDPAEKWNIFSFFRSNVCLAEPLQTKREGGQQAEEGEPAAAMLKSVFSCGRCDPRARRREFTDRIKWKAQKVYDFSYGVLFIMLSHTYKNNLSVAKTSTFNV